ncbi:MAG: NUDIX hydrolase [Polyangia bacterium]
MATRGEYIYPYPRPMVTVDTVVLREMEGRLEVLLIRRGKPPFEGHLALPGGFVEMEEDLPEAAARELAEETGIDDAPLEQVGAFGRPDRDPRGRNISVAFAGVVIGTGGKPSGGDDAASAEWVPLEKVGELAFDHEEILDSALHRLDIDQD